MPEENVEAGASLHGLHVVLIVDDAESRELLRTVLEHAGALVTVAASAGSALTALEAIRPDVLLTDMGDADEQPAAFIARVRALPGCGHAVDRGDGGRWRRRASASAAGRLSRARAEAGGRLGALSAGRVTRGASRLEPRRQRRGHAVDCRATAATAPHSSTARTGITACS